MKKSTSSNPRRREEVVYIDSEGDNIATEKDYGQVQAEIHDKDSTDKQCQAQDQRKGEEQTGGTAPYCTQHPNEGNPNTARKPRKWKTPEKHIQHKTPLKTARPQQLRTRHRTNKTRGTACPTRWTSTRETTTGWQGERTQGPNRHGRHRRHKARNNGEKFHQSKTPLSQTGLTHLIAARNVEHLEYLPA